MKIAFVLDDTLDSTDGVQQYVITLGEWLSSKGHIVHYLVGQSRRTDIDNVHSLAKNIPIRFNRNKLSIPLFSSLRSIKSVLEEQNFDIAHVQLPYSPMFASRVIKCLGSNTAVIGTFHILPYSRREKYGTKALALLVSKSNKRFDSLISVSEPARKFSKSTFNIDSKVIPNPVYFKNKHKKSNRYDSNHIVYLGRLVKRKGVIYLIHAYKQLIDTIDQDVKLTICGDGPMKNDVIKLISELGITDRVKLTGFVSEEEKYRYLNMATVAVFPSIGGESFGIVLTEAMAANAGAVVGGDNPGYRSVLENDDVLFNPKNYHQFSQCLAKFITNPDKLQSVHLRQQKQVKKFDVNIVGNEVLTVYKEAIANRNKSKHN
ncbi:glycosyltransferase family 4 protein [Candidatus Saccharibacteria bacterium]|nr:glycosyltransferase family 4 protein [Candidatus Saccharibacteria bacterium]